eukprot:g7828.t1
MDVDCSLEVHEGADDEVSLRKKMTDCPARFKARGDDPIVNVPGQRGKGYMGWIPRDRDFMHAAMAICTMTNGIDGGVGKLLSANEKARFERLYAGVNDPANSDYDLDRMAAVFVEVLAPQLQEH